VTRRLIVLFAILLIIAPARAHQPAGRGTDTLASLLDAATGRGEPPGLVALVVDGERTRFEHASGTLDAAAGTPMPVDAIFRIHSMTKPITTLAAMLLVDERRLDIDAPVSRYLPSFAAAQVLTSMGADGAIGTRPPATAPTIRHLLTHTSGVGYGFSDPTLLQLTRRTGRPEVELPLLHDPGARWTYGASTRLLGDVIESITGGSLSVFLEARIFVPLGMRDTFYRVPDEKRGRVASRHQRIGGRLVEEHIGAVEESPVRGDGGLYSTAHDYGRFMQLFLNDGRAGGRRLVSARAMRLMRASQIAPLRVSRQPVGDPALTRPFPIGAGRDGFSFGFQIAAPPAPGTRGRAAGSMSWGGLRNTHFWIDPRHDRGVVLMTQVLPFYDEEVMRLLAALEEAIYSMSD
jgi:CubicO group peptidase (beta-lactamase class C family)